MINKKQHNNGIAGSGAESTGQKRIEEALRESEKKYRFLAENTHDIIWTLDMDLRTTYVSPSIESALGFTPEERVKQDVADQLTPASLAVALEALTRELEYEKSGTAEPRRPIIIESEYYHKDGSTRWFENVVSGIRDSQGELIGLHGVSRDITGRRRVEAALRESEDNFHTFFDSVGDMVIVGSPDGKILQTNPAMSLKLGYSPEELRNMHVLDVHPPEKRSEAEAIFAAMFRGERETCPLPLRHKDGTWVPVETRVWTGKWSGQDCIYGLCKDLTREQEALQKFDRLFYNNPAPMAVSILPGREIIDVNNAWLNTLGFTREEVVGKNGEELGVFVQLEKQREVAQQLTALGRVSNVELKARRKDGTIVDGLFAGEIIESQGKRYLLTVMLDQTQRKQAEEALRESEEKYRMLVENAMESIFIASGGVLKFANHRATILSGYSQEELASRPFIEFVHPDDRPMIAARQVTRLQGEEVADLYSFRIICKGGETKWVDLNGTPISWEGKLATLNFLTDITDRKRLEEERQRVDKLEAVGLLAGGIAHDFNNILTAILGNISLASMEAAPGSELQNSLEQAEKASLRAKDLTVQLLTFSKGGAPVKKLVSLAELVKDTARFALRGSNVKCNFSLPGDLWHAEIDAGQVSQVIHNLVINAQQAMPDGGSVEISAENIALSEAKSIGKGLPLRAGDYIRIMVVDHGCGIPAEHLEKIFDAFFTTKLKGNGMGLATSFSIARQHGGHISVDSIPGSGSTFYLYLPASPKTEVTRQGERETLKPVSAGRVLLMDDEQGVREVAGRMLRRIGYGDIEFAADGAEAIKMYKAAMKSGRPFKLVILDLTVPGGMGGEVTVRLLRNIDPGVKAVVSSGYIDDPVIAKYEDYGFSGRVTKPYNIEEFGKALQEMER